jgi:hypothetical protein
MSARRTVNTGEGPERGDRRFGAPQGLVERHHERARDRLAEAPGQACPRQRVELADALEPQPPQGAAGLAIEPQRLDRQESERACLGAWRDDGEGRAFGKARLLFTPGREPRQRPGGGGGAGEGGVCGEAETAELCRHVGQ